MNKNIKLAVAGAVLAMSATAANAGIIIPAGDWTVDIGGNVNAFYTHTNYSGDLKTSGAPNTANVIQTGLLPSQFGIGAKTRQNDLDVAFQFSFFTGVDTGNTAGASSTYGANGSGGNNTLNIRQAYLSFGDKSWGQIKMGRDLGVFGSDAILSDMTLLGVGTAAGAGGNSTLGRIGSGYMYADWIGQIQYQSPNFSGFQVTGAVVEPQTNTPSGATADYGSNSLIRHDMGFQGKATYDFAANDVTGRVWLGGTFQKQKTNTSYQDDFWNTSSNYDSKAVEVGVKAEAHGFGIVGYYYDGEGISGSRNALNGLQYRGAAKTDDKGGYVQATYVLPTKTKLGVSWGESKSSLDGSSEFKNRSWIVGAYHPLTKHLNLVAEYTDQKLKNFETSVGAYDDDNFNGKARTVSLGAILFF